MPLVSNSNAYDLYFPTINLGLRLVPPRIGFGGVPIPNWEGNAGPAETNEDLLAKRTVPITWRNRGKGMGVSQFDSDLENDGDYDYGINLYSRTPGSWMPAGLATEVVISAVTALTGAGACTGSAVFLGDLYFAFGRYIVKITAGTLGGPIATPFKDLGAGFVAKRIQVFDGVMYVGGSGGRLWAYNGTTWTQSADVTALDLGTVYWVTQDGVGAQRLIIQDTATSFRQIASQGIQGIAVVAALTPLTLANYSASYQIAGGQYPINSIVSASQVVWFATAGGLATVDGRGYSPIINPYLGQQYSPTLNGEAALAYDDFVYMSHLRGIDRVYVGQAVKQLRPVPAQPGYGTAAEHPIGIRCTAMALDSGYLLAAMYNGTDAHLMAGDPSDTPSGRMAWHGAELKLAGERITHLRVDGTSPSNNPCIWVCSMAGGTPKLRYQSIPKSATPQQELLNNLTSGFYTGTMRWAPSSSLFFGGVDLGDQNVQKLVERYDISSRQLNAATTLRLFASAESGPFIQQGSGADPKLATSPRAALLPTAPLDSVYNLSLRLDGANPTTAPYLINQLKGRFEVIQPLRTNKTYQIELGPAPDLRSGATIDVDVAATLSALLALQSQGPLPMVDEMKLLVPSVKIEPGITWAPRHTTREGAGTEAWVLVATVSITTVPTTDDELVSGATTSVPVLPALVFDEDSWDESSWS